MDKGGSRSVGFGFANERQRMKDPVVVGFEDATREQRQTCSNTNREKYEVATRNAVEGS